MTRVALAAFLAALAAFAHADPVKCVDANGKVRYVDSSTPGTEKCTPVSSSGAQVVPSQPSYGTSSQTRGATSPQQRDADVRSAQNDLEQAKKALAEQESIRNGDEKNYQRVLDRLKPYQDAVEQARQNLERVQRESR